MDILYFMVILFMIIQPNGVIGITVVMNKNITAIVGEVREIRCLYTKENVKIIHTVRISVRNKTTNEFVPVVTFLPGLDTTFTTSGEYLRSRVILSNITQNSTEASMMFNQLKCTDENEYRCKVTYLHINIGPDTGMSLPTSIKVNVPPTKPHSLSIRGTVVSLTETDNATFICKGNVGRPPGKFIWRKRRSEDNFPEIYAHEITNYTKLEESCSYEGLSALTITLSEKDNQAVISCAVESLMSNDAMLEDTLPIEVLFKVQIPNIMKYPNRSMYSERVEVIILTCISNGNPPPTYAWYFNRTMIHTGSVLEIKNSREIDSGLYICYASNSFHGTNFEASNAVDINIITNTEKSGTSANKHSGTEVSTIVAVICGLVAVIIIILVTWIFHRHKCRRINKNSNSTDRTSQDMNIYNTIDDTSYERTGPLDNHPYNTICQTSSTEECYDKNTQAFKTGSIEDEHRHDSISTLPENLKTNERSYTNLEF